MPGSNEKVSYQDAWLTFLRLAGGTLKGPLTLSGNPTSDLHAVPLQWLGGLQITVVEIGGWDMDADATKAVAHGLAAANIVAVTGHVVNDAGNAWYTIPSQSGANPPELRFHQGGPPWGATNITLSRTNSGTFDSTAFNDDSSSRGKLVIFHT